MKTEIVRISGEDPDIQALRYCGSVIRDGGLVAFPTETVYGLGANAFNDGAVRNIFTAKNRPADNGSLQGMPTDIAEGILQEIKEVSTSTVRFRVEVDFAQMKDEAKFYYDCGSGFESIGIAQKLYFKLDHFTGCRFGLFVYSTKETGGSAEFSDFVYDCM